MNNSEVYLMTKDLISDENIELSSLMKNEVYYGNITHILANIDRLVRDNVYYCGLDEYILAVGSFNTSEYNKLVSKYNSLFEKDNRVSNKAKKRAFDYLKHELESYNIYQVIDINNKELCCAKLEDNDIIKTIISIYNQENYSDDYIYLSEFINYLKQELGVELELK